MLSQSAMLEAISFYMSKSKRRKNPLLFTTDVQRIAMEKKGEKREEKATYSRYKNNSNVADREMYKSL